jgi:hypothetical protein
MTAIPGDGIAALPHDEPAAPALGSFAGIDPLAVVVGVPVVPGLAEVQAVVVSSVAKATTLPTGLIQRRGARRWIMFELVIVTASIL